MIFYIIIISYNNISLIVNCNFGNTLVCINIIVILIILEIRGLPVNKQIENRFNLLS